VAVITSPGAACVKAYSIVLQGPAEFLQSLEVLFPLAFTNKFSALVWKEAKRRIGKSHFNDSGRNVFIAVRN
jgi:hypothetical protein